jgi:hypothetical protein
VKTRHTILLFVGEAEKGLRRQDQENLPNAGNKRGEFHSLLIVREKMKEKNDNGCDL